jgi:hypothetical protein
VLQLISKISKKTIQTQLIRNLIKSRPHFHPTVDILDYMSFSLSQLSDHQQARDVTMKMLELKPNNDRFKKNLHYFTKELGVEISSSYNSNFTAKHLPKVSKFQSYPY